MGWVQHGEKTIHCYNGRRGGGADDQNGNYVEGDSWPVQRAKHATERHLADDPKAKEAGDAPRNHDRRKAGSIVSHNHRRRMHDTDWRVRGAARAAKPESDVTILRTDT